MPDLPDAAIQAAAPGSHDVAAETEWGYRFPDGHVHYCAGGERTARYVASRNPGAVLVCRTVTYSPWEEATDA